MTERTLTRPTSDAQYKALSAIATCSTGVWLSRYRRGSYWAGRGTVKIMPATMKILVGLGWVRERSFGLGLKAELTDIGTVILDRERERRDQLADELRQWRQQKQLGRHAA